MHINLICIRGNKYCLPWRILHAHNIYHACAWQLHASFDYIIIIVPGPVGEMKSYRGLYLSDNLDSCILVLVIKRILVITIILLLSLL